MRRAFAHVPSGLAIVATLGPDGLIGLLVASFTSVSLTPPLASVNIGHSSTTLLAATAHQPHWGISILAQDQSRSPSASGARHTERFAGLGWSSTIDGAVHLRRAAAGFTTRLNRLIPAGDLPDPADPEVADHFATLRAPLGRSTAADCAASSPRGGERAPALRLAVEADGQWRELTAAGPGCVERFRLLALR